MTIDAFLKTNKGTGGAPGTVQELAKQVRVSRQTVYNWMRGRYQPHFIHVMRLVQVSHGAITMCNGKTLSDDRLRNLFSVAGRLVDGEKEVANV
jgi:DNA-binding XRE family transcriptional regulator